MLHRNKFLTLLLLLALLISACQPIVAPVPSTDETTEAEMLSIPRFETSDCMYPVPEGGKMECGYLIVPEDRGNPDSPMIRLHVVNFKSLSDTPQSDPIFAVNGGPGATGHIFGWWFTSDPWASALRAERDIIYLEHRGTNFSEPAFYCPELEADVAELVAMSFGEEIEYSAAAVQACAERTRQEGYNLSTYNALAIAADLADLRIALGYDEVNVFGVSYGTTVSMLWMQHYPEGIRSIILDSVAPPNVNWLDMQLAVVDGALNTLFDACAADPICDSAYPDLETAFTTVLTSLRQAPVMVTVEDGTGASYEIQIDDEMFVSYVREGMFFGDGFTSIPAGIYAAYSGDFAPVGAARLGFLQDRHAETGPGTWSMSKGAYYTNMCTLSGSTTDMERALAIYASVGSDPSVFDWAVNYILTDTLAACEYWQLQPPAPNVWEQTVESESPVLMLVGTFDSDSAPLLSEAYRDAFANGYYYALPFGHVSMMSPCGLELMTQFLADPTLAPDASCIDAMTPQWILPE